MTDKKNPKPALTNGNLIRPDADLQQRINAYHEAFEAHHGVRVPRPQILLKLIRDGLDAQDKE
jgi:hypothetical protein